MGQGDPVVTAHPAYLALGSSTEARSEAYRAIVAQGCEDREADEIRSMTSRQRAFGARSFKDELEATYHRPMGIVRRGRPRLEPEPGV
jgi:putative transposase